MDAVIKAKELIEKYLRIEDNTKFYWNPYYDRRYIDDEVFIHAVKCAKILVEEIIESCPSYKYWDTYDDETPSAITFWNEVKIELDKFINNISKN